MQHYLMSYVMWYDGLRLCGDMLMEADSEWTRMHRTKLMMVSPKMLPILWRLTSASSSNEETLLPIWEVLEWRGVAWRGVVWRKEATYDGFDSPNYHPNAMESRDNVWNTHSSLGRYLPFVGLSVSYMLTPVLYLEVLIWLESHPAVCLQRIVHNSNCPPRTHAWTRI